MHLRTILAFIAAFGAITIYSQEKIADSVNQAKCGVIDIHFIEQDTTRCTNGLSLGVFQRAKSVNGISLGLFGSYLERSNGISVNTFYSNGSHNGLSISSVCNNRYNNGLSIALLNIGDHYNGVTVGGWTNYAGQYMNGISIATFFNRSPNINGLAVSLLHNSFDKQSGVSISVFNKTEELHGFQFGLLNYAGNNRKIFRWIPFFNFNFT